MKTDNKAIILRICCIVLTLSLFGGILFHVSANTRYFEGEAEAYRQALMEAGFPQDYALLLTELHLLHPEWTFTPLIIRDTNSKYTWSYVIQEETKEEDNNIISSDQSQIAYRHPTNQTVYDAGSYQASTAAVEYFMDPRNFINETDIFQFYNLSDATKATLQGVQAILEGTFMENATLENGSTYAEYFMELGSILSIDPVYLAVKARQEQGTGGTSPLISGSCGDKLWELYQNGDGSDEHTQDELLAYNGLYNFYNISAYGNGHFNIYLKGMQRALSGTDDMAESWGSPAWNTRWKSLYGGAYTIKKSYIDRYQPTIYLQKFNVDGRSTGNFWRQYMQNVGGSLTESRTLYSSFASLDILDRAYDFLIPVYANMPKDPCPDPAGGTCSYLAAANDKFDYTLTLREPTERTVQNAPLYLSREIPTQNDFVLEGKVEHSYGVLYLEYQWDGGEWIAFEQKKGFSLALPIDFSEGSSHILVIRGRADYDHGVSTKKSNSYFLVSVMYITIQPPPIAYIMLSNKGNTTNLELPMGSVYALPDIENPYFVGWRLGEELHYAGEEILLKKDLRLHAAYLDLMQLDGAALVFEGDAVKMRYTAAVNADTIELLSSIGGSVQYYAELKEAEAAPVRIPVTQDQKAIAYETDWLLLKADTELIASENWNTFYTVSFFAEYRDPNGNTVTLPVSNTPSATRTPSQIAQMALSDPYIIYAPTHSALLREIASAAY